MIQKEILVEDELGRNFSRAVKLGDLILISGVTGRVDLKTWKEIPEAKGNITFQTRQAFEWLKMVLEKCNSSLRKVAKLTIYLLNFDDLPKVLEVFRQYFPDEPPAVDAIGVSRLVGIAEIEISAVATA